MLLQAYDFLVLHDRYGCNLQMGGSDQWGNITAGIDLDPAVRGAQAHGLVLPLVTNAVGHQVRQDRSGSGLARRRRSPRRSASTSSGSTPTIATS